MRGCMCQKELTEGKKKKKRFAHYLSEVITHAEFVLCYHIVFNKC